MSDKNTTATSEETTTIKTQSIQSSPLTWVFASLGSLIIVGLVIFGIVFFTTINSQNSDETNNAPLSSTLIPEITNFVVDLDVADPFTGYSTFTVGDIEKPYILEYRIQNEKTRVLVSGEITSAGLAQDTLALTPSSENLTLKARATDGERYSNWITVEETSVELPERKEDPEVNEAYYSTPWALKETTTIEALRTAVETAVGGTLLNEEEDNSTCATVSHDVVKPGEIMTPQPRNIEGMDLKYSTYERGDGSYQLIYYWCE